MAALGGALAYHRGVAALDRQLADKFSLSANVLANQIERLRHLPHVLGEDPRLHRALQAPNEPAAIAEANLYLKRLRSLTGADETYLIGADGITLAASNWDEPGSFVGMNYAFRPYFRRGMAEGEAHYYAIGVTTGKPGAFLAARMTPRDGPKGLAVVKMELTPLESTWARAGEVTLVSDEAGMVFLSSHPQWRFRPLAPLAANTLEKLGQEQRYAGIDLANLAPLPVKGRYFYAGLAETYRLYQGRVPQSDWQMLVALPLAPVTAMAGLFAALSGAAGALAALGTIILYQRRQILRLRLIEADRLERAVRQRTAELAREITERERTEQELRRMQEGLVHAAKLAVLGRMSSAIVHEIGQSLSALDNNLAAAELHGKSGDLPRLAPALGRARAMLQRLQGVVVRLRSFAAKQSLVALAPVELMPVFLTAQEIVTPRAKELAVAIHLPEGELPQIMADGPRLEQVMANLLLNGIEASASSPEPRQITVDVEAKAQEVEILLHDSGAGFAQDVIEDLGQPFNSHGKGSAGLGLGLYIVQNLMEQMRGSIRFANAPAGRGALVRLCFQRAQKGE